MAYQPLTNHNYPPKFLPKTISEPKQINASNYCQFRSLNLLVLDFGLWILNYLEVTKHFFNCLAFDKDLYTALNKEDLVNTWPLQSQIYQKLLTVETHFFYLRQTKTKASEVRFKGPRRTRPSDLRQQGSEKKWL